VERRASFCLSTIQLCTENTPFQPPVRPENTITRASGYSRAAGRLPVLDQSASRQLRGPPSNANQVARAAIGSRNTANSDRIMILRRDRRGLEGTCCILLAINGFRLNHDKTDRHSMTNA